MNNQPITTIVPDKIYTDQYQTYEQNECRGEPYVRPRTKTGIEPMPEGQRFIYILDHRFDTGFFSRANIRFAPSSARQK